MRTSIAAAGVAVAIVAGAVACSTEQPTQYDYVVQYGYYDHGHHYHYYSHPKTVRVTHKYYVTHSYQYKPHGTQHTVKVVTPKPVAKPKTYKPAPVKTKKSLFGSSTRKKR